MRPSGVADPPTNAWAHPDSLEIAAEAVMPTRAATMAAMRESIKAHGILVPLLVKHGRVIDGIRRLETARQLKLEQVPIIELNDGPNAIAVAMTTGVARRHLTTDQLAVLAARWLLANPSLKGGDRRSASARTKRDHVGPLDSHPGRARAAALFAVSVAKVKKATQLERSSASSADAVFRGETGLSQALAQLHRAEVFQRIADLPPPRGKYTTLLVDPPWEYDDSGCRGAAANEYPTMSLSEIGRLPVMGLLDRLSHLYLCTTGPMLPSAFGLMSGWGVDYKTTLVWKKPRLGLGRYFRSQTEFVLFGTVCNLPTKMQNQSNFFEAAQGRHSAKPDALYELVERASPGPYLELFARRARPGWSAWGAEATT